MKNILVTISLLVSLCGSGQNLDFSGKIAGLQKGTKVILTDLRPNTDFKGKRFHDTAFVDEGVFKFNVKLPGAGIYVLRVGLVGANPEHRVFYLDAGKVELTGTRGELNQASISGLTPYMKDYLGFMTILENQEVFGREKRLTDSMTMYCGTTGSYDGLKGHEDMEGRFFAVKTEAAAKKVEVAKKWLVMHPHSDINAYVMYTYLYKKNKDTSLKGFIGKLSPAARRSFPGKAMVDPLNN